MTFQKTYILTFCYALLNLVSSAAAEWNCDLNAIMAKNGGTLPLIIISGERHDDYNCKVDQDHLREAAIKGKIFLAEEGSFFETESLPKENIFGLEDDFVYTIANFNVDLVYMSGGVKDKEADKALALRGKNNFISIFINSPFMNQVYKDIRAQQKIKTSASAEEQEISKVIDEIVLKPKERESIINALPADHPWYNYKTFTTVMSRIFGATIREAKNEKYKIAKKVPDNLDEYVANITIMMSTFQSNFVTAGMLDATYKWEEFRNQYIRDWRNLFFADNLAKIYCEAAKKNQPLYAIVGSLHIPGLKSLLAEKFSTFPQVNIEVRNAKESSLALTQLYFDQNSCVEKVKSDYQHCPHVMKELERMGMMKSSSTPWPHRVLDLISRLTSVSFDLMAKATASL